MCNAFGYLAPVSVVSEAFAELRIPLRFEGAGGMPNLEPRQMIRPTEGVAVVRACRDGGSGQPPGGGDGGADGGESDGEAELSLMRWGFAPPAPKRPPVINFRSEGRSFGREGRALILASHFFEYTGAKSPKTRWRFTRVDGAGDGAQDPFAIAGWVRAAPSGPNPPLTSAGEPWPQSVTMLTCPPGPDVAPLHDRQIVILDRSDWRTWLFGEAEAARNLLRPSPPGSLRVVQDS